jgi:hypothetical protein
MAPAVAIEDLLNALVDHLIEEQRSRRPCDHTLAQTRAWLRQHCPDQEPGFLAFLRQSGSECDCQVLSGALAVRDPYLF